MPTLNYYGMDSRLSAFAEITRGDLLGESREKPKGTPCPPSGLRVARMSVNWEGKDGSEGAAVGVQRLGA